MIRRWWTTIRNFDRFTGALLLATCALAGFAAVTSVQIQRYQGQIVELSNYNLSYVYARTQIEILRLHAAISDAILDDEGTGAAKLRWAIVKGRISTIPIAYGPIDVPEAATARDNLEKTLFAIRPLIAALDSTESGIEALNALDRAANEFTRLTALANVRQSEVAQHEQELLAATMVRLSSAIFLTCCIGLALLVVVFRQKQRLRQAAVTDVLTGLPNRAAIYDWKPAGGKPVTIALAVIDVDRFKDVNDELGHAEGDALLRCLADVLRDQAGDDALAARLGGDEFVVIFTGKDAWKRAESRCAAIEDAFRSGCQTTDFAGATLSIGISVGTVASSADIELLMTQADGAMYGAKRDHRNAVPDLSGRFHRPPQLACG
ncbi:GGDEF domain-containing protein [Jiella avicenniae]|uniref:diguanylate cyclase n=1 Tax=Jiella avicenniae TaxID=2907202 RepID=A0A9X1P228_9HYPH|nr:GGDEF domain-containing protein [Jiella avicenniae]MCE7027876.1 GGDEF domain-containing protein [Jiella avicenniae]